MSFAVVLTAFGQEGNILGIGESSSRFFFSLTLERSETRRMT